MAIDDMILDFAMAMAAGVTIALALCGAVTLVWRAWRGEALLQLDAGPALPRRAP